MNYLFVLIAILITSPASEESKQRLFAADGSESVVELLAIDESRVRLNVLSETKSLSSDAINVIQFSDVQMVRKDGLQIRLVDGSIVNAADVLVGDGVVAEVLEDGVSRQSINTRNVSTLALVPVTSDLSTRWQELMQSTQRDSDWLIFDRDGALDYIEGKAGVISGTTVSFTTEDRTAEAPRNRVTGVAYFHASGRTFVEPIAILSTVDGSQLNLRSLRPGDERKGERPDCYFAETVCGAEFVFLPPEIYQIDFAAVRFQYLGNLVPSTIEWNPIFYNEAVYEYQAMLNGPRFNQSYSNQPLSLNFATENARKGSTQRVKYQQGIAIKGGTRLVFPLEGRYSRLHGWLGFSPEAPRDGLVEILFLGDGKELLRKVIDNRADSPTELDLEIRDVRRLTMQVNYHDGRNIGDIIHFCDAKVSR